MLAGKLCQVEAMLLFLLAHTQHTDWVSFHAKRLNLAHDTQVQGRRLLLSVGFLLPNGEGTQSTMW